MQNYLKILILTLLFYSLLFAEVNENEFEKARKNMVEIIKEEVKETKSYLGYDKLDKKVIDALSSVKRHKFVPKKSQKKAYKNRPLRIGYGQTISQPYIVAYIQNHT